MQLGPQTLAARVIVLDVPPDFHQVPLETETETETRTASQLRVLEDMGLTDPGQREALSLYLEALAIRLSRGTVIGTAFCAVQLEGRPSTATLTVALHPTGTADQGLAVMGAGEAMRREGRCARVDIRELGMHPAVTTVVERPAVPGDASTGEVGATLREMSVLLPVPGHEHAAMITLSTPCLEDWEVYEALLLDIARSLQVEQTHPVFTR
ncbi:MAG: hypothetical protein H0U36_09315 [Nocardioidaceae bacterium]|nr:hypothetical protein [Nocardioidaceae bacterium]